MLEQLKSGLKSTINWNKYESKVSVEAPDPYLDFLTNPSFQGVNRLFILLFESNEDRNVHTKYYLPLEIKDVMIDGWNFVDQSIKMNLIRYDNIRKIATGLGGVYTTGSLLDCGNYYKVIAIDLSKQQELDADPKAIQQINFTGNLNRGQNVNNNTIMFLII